MPADYRAVCRKYFSRREAFDPVSRVVYYNSDLLARLPGTFLIFVVLVEEVSK